MFSPMLLTVALVLGQTPPTLTPGPAPATGPRIFTPLKGTAAEGSTPPLAQSAPSGLPSLVVPAPATGPITYDWTATGSNGSANGNGATGSNGSANGNGAGESKGSTNGDAKEEESGGHFFRRFCKAYYDEFKKKDDGEEEPERPRRGLPSPWSSPPFPGSEYQGYPILGAPVPTDVYPFMKAVYGANTPLTDAIKDSRIMFSGWVTTSGNWSTAKSSNVPASYWIVPNRYELDQLVFKLERYADTVQTDHIDYGFRFLALYGIDYRYTTAGGWGSDQLLEHNKLNGWDPTELYVNFYIPGFLGGTDIRIGRWIACPDIETQYAPDNYMGSHSILFTYDTYTQTGVMLSQKLNDQWMVQGVVHAGTDMAPWYKGSVFSGAAGVRWVSKSNNDAFYTWLNSINSAHFRHFEQYGQPLGHDNFNYIVTTWEHRFTKEIHTKTEAYFMWQYDAEVGGTPSAGPVEPFGGGGGDGIHLPGLSRAYGVLNYTMFGLTKQDYLTFRNEWYRDERGMRTGFAGTYTSHTIGLSHNFNALFQVRPEIGYYRNWNQPAFDNGNSRGIWLYGFDMTLRF